MLNSKAVCSTCLCMLFVSAGCVAERKFEKASPDGLYRVEVLEKVHPLIQDHNLRIYIVDPAKGDRKLIFTSPDESVSNDQEVLQWSKDSKWCLLSGNRFSVDPEIQLEDGTTAYFMCDSKGKELYCNATQSDLPRLTVDVMNMAGFHGELKDRKLRHQ